MEKKTKHLIRNILWAIIILFVCSVAYKILGSMRKAPPSIPMPETVASVEICDAVAKDEVINIYTQGTVEPRTSSSFVSQVSGEILSVSPAFYVGGYFHKGDVLLNIDPIDYEVALTKAESSLAQSRLSYMQEQAQSAQAKKDWENMGMEGQPSDLTLRIPQLKQAEAAIKSAKALVAQAQQDLDNTKVIAPYDGLVTAKNVDMGQYVTAGTALGSIFATDSAEIRLSVKESDLKFIDLPEKLNSTQHDWSEVTLSGKYGGYTVKRDAKLVRSEGTIDPTSRLIYLIAKLDDPYALNSENKTMPVGMFVNATIIGRRYKDIIKLPRYALRGTDTVLVVDTDSRIDVRKVNVLKTDEEYVYISKGISDGERICLTALEFVVPGLKVADINKTSLVESAKEEAPATKEDAK